jgi:phage-related minor tail protein
MKRIDYWKAKLKTAQVEERIRQKELNQMTKAFERALQQVTDIEQRIEDEKAKLARTE